MRGDLQRRVRPTLGSVFKADPLFDRSQLGEAEKAAGGVIASCGHAPAILKPIEEALDPISCRIQGAVDIR